MSVDIPTTISVVRYERLKRINQLLCQGGYEYAEIASLLGVAEITVKRDVEYIKTKWWAAGEDEDTKVLRVKRVKEFEHLKKLSLESYFRSRQDKTEIKTRYDSKECEDCKGTGVIRKGVRCLNCEGTGHVNEEVVQRTVTGSPGDVGFLREAASHLREICKLEGLYQEPVTVQHVVSGALSHSHKLEDRFKECDPELIIKAKAAMALLESEQMARVIDGEVIEEGMQR